MLDSDILEVAIGLAMVFALVSTICTAVREWLEMFLKSRASFLDYGIRQLLNDPHARGIARDLFNHPLVSGLYIGNYEKGDPKESAQDRPNDDDTPKRSLKAANSNLPSYIPATNFAKALIDIVARGPAGDVAVDSSSQPISLARLRGNLAHIDNPQLQRVMLTALDTAEGDVNRLQAELEAWYDSAMDRVSGWYKRTTQKILFVIALVIAALLNVNTITVADYLFRHDAERTALVASIAAPSSSPDQQKLAVEDANKKLDGMHLPIGWTGDSFLESWGAPRTRAERLTIALTTCDKIGDGTQQTACQKNVAGVKSAEFHLWEDFWAPVVGLLLTAFAATLGAPFWFDVLSKFMVVRSTSKPPEAEKKDKAKQPASAAATRPGAPASVSADAAAAATVADDQCGVGADVAVTSDDRLPAATGGVA